MEQATNTFNKGLLTDTNPMILGNDTLTDCLNGTLITMNGNEVILLNDMGNRRVDNAYLPSGYEPVGIKEYGGIIYIAAYNPITNKSLIGSFPSPLLKYGSSSGLLADVDDTLFNLYFTDSLFPGINFLKNFIVLTPFVDSNSKKVILHTGDKFTVYGSLTPSKITNYNNVDGNKLNSPKNKKYTLSLGVLNSLNEFVDFTESLLRWDADNLIVTFDDNTPDYIKFNTGYFIPSSYSPPNSLTYTILDLDFIKNRLAISANTYAYKLVGPLYIRKELNIIDNLTYNVYGNFYKDETTKKTEIFIETIYEYNCPDGDAGGVDTTSDKYVSLGETSAGNTFNTLYSTIKVDGDTIANTSDYKKLVEDTKYNEETNLYKAIKIAKTSLDKVEGIIKVIIVPRTSNSFGIRNLSYIESFDLSKLNSNEIELTDFRFYSNLEEQTTNLVVGFKAYPKYRNSFKGLKISIYPYYYYGLSNIMPLKEFEWGESGYNGVKTFTWDWNISNKSHFFPVVISYTIEDDNPFDTDGGQTINTTKKIKRWIMTTNLFNNCFYSSSNDFVRDYGKYDDNKKYDPIIESLLIVKPISVNTNVKDNEVCNIYLVGDYSPYKLVDADFDSRVLTIYNEDIEIDGHLDFDRDLYPYELALANATISNIYPRLLNGNTNVVFGGLFPERYTIDQTTYLVKNNITSNITNLSYNLKYNTDLIGRETYKAEVKSKSVVIEKLFKSFYDYFDNNHLPYATIALDSWDESGTDEHAIYFSMLDSNSKNICEFGNDRDDGAPYSTCKIINHTGAVIRSNHEYSFYFPTEKDAINSGIDSILGKKLVFVGTNNCFMNSFGKIYAVMDDESHNSTQCPPRPILFWMKTQDGWAMLPLLEFPTGVTYDLNSGWLGPTSTSTSYVSWFNDERVTTYIKSRIKDFYYIGENNSSQNLYAVDVDKAPTIISYENPITITLQIKFSSTINTISEAGSIGYCLPTGRSSLFTKSSNIVENIGFSKDITFKKTQTFETLIEYIEEKLSSNTIDVALESNNQLYFLDYSGTLFNPNVIYVKENDNKFYPVNLSVVYDGTLPLIEAEHENCGLEWMYATDDNDYFGDDNDETYFYLGGVPTIPRILLKK